MIDRAELDRRRVAAVSHILNVSYGLASEVSSAEGDIERDQEETRQALQVLGVTADELDEGEKAMFMPPFDFRPTPADREDPTDA